MVQYLQAQETKPFIKAESAYRKLIAKMAEKAAADGNAQITDESASAGSDAQDWILDPDPVITSYCLWKRIAVPRIISAKLRIHIRALYAWAGGAWLIHSNQ